jgi:16S rRNA (guanine527-N7)-methyltransferase
VQVLHEARDLGFLGPGPVDAHLEHAAGFARVLASRRGLGGPVLDLGSGGGLPGLVVAELLPDRALALLDGSERRAAWLAEVVERCGLLDRVVVVGRRAEVAGREDALRGRFAAVTARSFAAPPVTAECAAPFLIEGGVLVVSEPPSPPGDRWPIERLESLGLVPEAVTALPEGHYQVLTMVGRCPDRYPRRVGIPAKRPLYRVLGSDPGSVSPSA